MKAVHKLATVGALIGAAALAGVGVAGGSHASSSQANTPNDWTITVKGSALNWSQSEFGPKVTCPAWAPYLLNKEYNQGSGFRNGPGVELSDYKSGFDSALSLVSTMKIIPVPGGPVKDVATGMPGTKDIFKNTVTYWGFDGQSSYTLTVHCTNDLKNAYIL
jgi:hypothetical protein